MTGRRRGSANQSRSAQRAPTAGATRSSPANAARTIAIFTEPNAALLGCVGNVAKVVGRHDRTDAPDSPRRTTTMNTLPRTGSQLASFTR
jgi:hypothetical protein